MCIHVHVVTIFTSDDLFGIILTMHQVSDCNTISSEWKTLNDKKKTDILLNFNAQAYRLGSSYIGHRTSEGFFANPNDSFFSHSPLNFD